MRVSENVKRVSVEAWHKAGLDGGDASGLLLCKVGPPSEIKAVGESGLKQRFTISTSAVDREGDRIDVKGWALDNFIAGGSILLGHNRDFVVAKPSDTRVSRRALRSVAEFPTRDVSERAHEVGQLVGAGFIRSSSVGFMPGEWEISERELRGVRGIDFKSGHELFEWSVLPVAANPEALAEAKSKGLGLTVLRSWAEQELDCGRTLVMPTYEAEQLYKDADEKAAVSVSVPESLECGAISWASAHPDGTPKQPDDTVWNGPREVAAADVDVLAIISAWFDDENPDVKSSYKLQHHTAQPGHAVNRRGTIAAMGAIFGARGGVDVPDADRRGIYNHLARHYREDLDLEPPEFRAYSDGELKELFPDSAVQMTLTQRRDASLAHARAAESEMVAHVEMALTALSTPGGVAFPEHERRLRAAFERHGWAQSKDVDISDEVARALPGIIQGAVASAMAQ